MIFSCHCLQLSKYPSRPYLSRHNLNRRSTITRLYETVATSSGPIVLPTVYESDLYGVLGLSLNATKIQLKEAYWAIAFKTHPDRNDTPEALSQFRNASYAFKILGKSEQTRSDYDSKYRTKQYIESLDQLSRDVITPFAMEVAIPLINQTFRGLSSFAVPFLKDAFEQSSSIFQAAFKADSQADDDQGFHALKRATDAAVRTGLEQKIRRTKESIDYTTEKFDNTNEQVLEATQKEAELKASLNSLEISTQNSKDSLTTIMRESLEAETNLASIQELQKIKESEWLRSSEIVTSLVQSGLALWEARVKEDEEISRLEVLLSQAHSRSRKILIKQTTLDISVSAENRTNEALKFDYDSLTSDVARSLSSYESMRSEIKDTQIKASDLQREETAINLQKQNYLVINLGKKRSQLLEKQEELKEVLKNVQQEYDLKDQSMMLESKRLLESTVESYEANKIRMENDYKEIEEMELSIKQRERDVELMELERDRLINQEKQELENIQHEAIRKNENLHYTDNNQFFIHDKTLPIPPGGIPKQKVQPIKEKYVYKPKNKINLKVEIKSEDLTSKMNKEDKFDDFFRF